jgi:hypothetical protein
MPKKIGEINLVPGGQFDFNMSGDTFYIEHDGKKVTIDDSELVERVTPKSCEKNRYVTGNLFGFEDKWVRVPDFVLKTRDVTREIRKAEHSRKQMLKIGETSSLYGTIDFFMQLGDLFVIGIESDETIINDEQIKNDLGVYRVPASAVKGAKGYTIEIPDSVIHTRDTLREAHSASKLLKLVDKIEGPNSPIRFYLKNTGELVIKYNNREVVIEELETIYGKAAAFVSYLELGHPYIAIPEEVEAEFRKLQSKIAMDNLHLTLVGTSVLDGKKYFKLSAKIPTHTWDRVKPRFAYFGSIGDFSGWLTCEPDKVEFALNIKQPLTTDSTVSVTV